MTNVKTEDLNEFILKKLRKRQKANEITFEVSQKYDLKWDEATKIVTQVQKNHSADLQKYQNRGTTLFSIGFVLIGILLVLGIIYATLTGWVLFVYQIPYSGNLLVLGAGIVFILGGFAGILTRNRK